MLELNLYLVLKKKKKLAWFTNIKSKGLIHSIPLFPIYAEVVYLFGLCNLKLVVWVEIIWSQFWELSLQDSTCIEY